MAAERPTDLTVPDRVGARARPLEDEAETLLDVPTTIGEPTRDDPELTDQRDTERVEDDLATLNRSRQMLAVGLALIPLYLLLDLLVATYIEPTAVWKPMAVHAVGFVHIGITLAVLWRWSPAPVQLLRFERFTTIATAAISCLACVVAGGIDSVYGLTVTVILLARLAMRSDRIRDAWPSVFGAILVHPAVVLGAALFSPRLAAQLEDPGTVATLIFFASINTLVGTFVLAGGQSAWQLRRDLFEARQIGRYRLRRQLGVGGMGEVWAAYYPALKREVALKILRLGSDNRQAVARFEREVHATAMLSHPNTVRVFDHGVTDGMWYYAMELLEGETLARVVQTAGPLHPRRAARLIHQAARALAEAHDHGIIHRDVKPENLFVTTAGGEPDFVKVLDFGIARLAERAESVTLTATGAVPGTPTYTAPEVLAGKIADERADVYGLGASLYYALCGRPPFSGKTLAAVISAVSFDPLVPPSEVRGQPLPEGLEAIALRALSRQPEDRHADAAVMAAELGQWLADRD